MVKPEYPKSAVKSRVKKCREKITDANRGVSGGSPSLPVLRAGSRPRPGSAGVSPAVTKSLWRGRPRPRPLTLLLWFLPLILLIPHPAQAYVGPGAGFAVLSSFWTLFVAFFYSLYAFVTWPLRQF